MHYGVPIRKRDGYGGVGRGERRCGHARQGGEASDADGTLGFRQHAGEQTRCFAITAAGSAFYGVGYTNDCFLLFGLVPRGVAVSFLASTLFLLAMFLSLLAILLLLTVSLLCLTIFPGHFPLIVDHFFLVF